jgi:predicted RNase H-like nuclease (RuvC/YqgF family)
MDSMASQSVDQNVLQEKDKEINNLTKQIDNYKNQVNILTEELTKADEDFEKIESEYEKLKQNPENAGDSKIMDFTIKEITREDIINEMKNILKESTHSVTIAVPKIDDLQELQLYEVRSSVNMKISCEINPGLEGHTELLDEYESLDNISLRHFEGADRYIINRDGEELLIAIKGSHENNHLVFKTKDPSHIKFLSSLVMESWLRSKKL